MNIKFSVVGLLVLISAIPSIAQEKKNGQLERGMLEKMEAVPCGSNQKGITGLGSLWASAGITHINSNEKLCPQYLLRTDDMDYQIRPTNLKHPPILPVGQEGQFRIKKNQMYLSFPEAHERKTRTYQVVGMIPTKTDADQDKSARAASDDR